MLPGGAALALKYSMFSERGVQAVLKALPQTQGN